MAARRYLVQEWYAGCWMQRRVVDELEDARDAISCRLGEWPERVYRAVEENGSDRTVVIAANEPGEPIKKRRRAAEPDTMDSDGNTDEGASDED